MKSIYLLATFVAFSLFACKNDPKQSKTNTTTPKVAEAFQHRCLFSTKPDKIKVNWTAYKTTKRVGVKGTFNDIQVNTAQRTPDLTMLIQATTFKINTSTVNSNNEARDTKLVSFFFKKLVGDIVGNATSVSGDKYKGTGTFAIKMNNISKIVPFDYIANDSLLTISTAIDMANWNGLAAIESINKACEDKHKGEDGISKTWPDVSVEIAVPLIIECD